MSHFVERFVVFLIGSFVLAVWTVLGLFFWIPLLARATIYFASMVVVSSLTESDLTGAQIGLDRAVRFYPSGFRRILRSLADPPPADAVVKAGGLRLWLRTLYELVYTVAIWAVTLLALSTVFSTLQPLIDLGWATLSDLLPTTWNAIRRVLEAAS